MHESKVEKRREEDNILFCTLHASLLSYSIGTVVVAVVVVVVVVVVRQIFTVIRGSVVREPQQ